jgi:energy-coupling factor transporter ATP-binding protein EcfA2
MPPSPDPLHEPTSSEAAALAAIVAWSADCPAWQRDALRRLCSKERLEASDIDALMLICKGAGGPADPLIADHVRDPAAGSSVVTLSALYGVQHVNALAEGERLTFDKMGVTIIYGDNGAGKSGYARILKKVCRARSPKNESVLPNVYAGKSGVPTAMVDFCAGGTNRTATWANGHAPDPTLSAVSVFDGRTASIHVDQTNDVAYTPLPLKILAGLAQACQDLKGKLNAEIKTLEAQKPAVLAQPQCQPGTVVGKLIAGLAAKTKPETVTALATLSDAEKARLETLTADLSGDPARVARQLLAVKTRLDTTLARLEKLTVAIADDRILEFRAAAQGYAAARTAAAAASMDLFSGDPLPDIGSEAWKILWDAARSYSQVSAYPDRPFPATEARDRCVLCHQELDADAADRLRRFDAFVRDDSKRREGVAHQVYEAAFALMTGARIARADVTGILALMRDDLAAAALVPELRRAVVTALWRLRAIMRAHTKTNAPALPVAATMPTEALRVRSQDLESRATALLAEDDSPARKELIAERQELADRTWLALVQADVLAQIERLKEIDLLGKAVKDTATNRVTSKSTEIAQTLVTDMLRSRFAREVDQLGIAGLAIEMRQEKTSQGVPFFRVSLINKPTETVGNVLSEGEHRCVALAAFLAELATIEARSAIVLDDPVSSLDHRHRERVAARLAKEGKGRQVVVFTHDIAFLFLLYEACREAATHVAFRSINRGTDFSGFCQANPPPNAMPVDKVVEGMQRQLDNVTIHHERGNQGEWYRAVRSLQEQLRTTWERAVEDALAPVIKRLANKVDTKGLPKITVLDMNDCVAMRDAYGRCSALLHSEAEVLNTPLPAPIAIAAEITVLRDWVANIRQRQEKVRLDA